MPAFNVSCTTLVESDSETVFNTLSDFATWNIWSPWLLSDKNATVTLKGDPKKVGGGYSWDGEVVGAGEMEHTKLQPPSGSNSKGRMDAQLRFTRPWKSESKVYFDVGKTKNADGADVTQVTWNMEGSLPFFLFWMKNMMINMLSMDFDRGLRMLKELIETGEVKSKTDVLGLTEAPSVDLVGASGKATLAEIGPAMGTTMNHVKDLLSKSGIATDGQWLSIYDDMCMKTQTVTYTSGMVLPAGADAPSGLAPRSLDGFNAIHIRHTGRYEHMGNAWSAAYQNLQAMKRKASRKLPGLEFYANCPDDTPPEDLVTDVYVPVK